MDQRVVVWGVASGEPIVGFTADGRLSHNEPPSVEYLDRAGLLEVLSVRKKGVSAVLQRFVAPRGTHNAVVQALCSVAEPRSGPSQTAWAAGSVGWWASGWLAGCWTARALRRRRGA